MTQTRTKNQVFINFIYILFLLISILTLVIIPKQAITTFGQGVNLWATKVLPSLLPFFILTKLLSYTTFVNSAGRILSPITKKLYGVGGVAGYIYFISIVSGYPVGAKLTSDLYEQKAINREQAKAISSFTSTSGPLFILGTVGIGFFNSSRLGIIVLISHLISALLNGLLYRNKEAEFISPAIPKPTSQNQLSDSMYNSVISIMMVGGFIAIFYMGLKLMLQLNIFSPIIFLLSKCGIDEQVSASLIAGMIEVTTGLSILGSSSIKLKLSTVLASVLISFGGLSIHAQAFCYLKNFGLKYSHFLKQKVTNAILAALVTLLIILLI